VSCWSALQKIFSAHEILSIQKTVSMNTLVGRVKKCVFYDVCVVIGVLVSLLFQALQAVRKRR
jgi:hypothetical protein